MFEAKLNFEEFILKRKAVEVIGYLKQEFNTKTVVSQAGHVALYWKIFQNFEALIQR